MTINEIQDEIIEEFSGLDDWMDKYQLLIDLFVAQINQQLILIHPVFKTTELLNNLVLYLVNCHLSPI